MESLLEIFVESPSSSLVELLLNNIAEPCFGSFDKLPLGNFFPDSPAGISELSRNAFVTSPLGFY